MALVPTSITDRLKTLLQGCKGTSYPSNVGTTVLVGQVKGAEQQAPCLFMIPERETADQRYAQHLMTRTYRLAAFAKLSAHPTLSEHGLIDQIIYDVRKVMETRDSTLAALTNGTPQFISAQPGYHEDGGQIVGAALEYQITFNQAAPA